MNSAVIVDCLRTPIGRAHPERGFFRHTRSDDLMIACMRALVDRTQIDPSQIDDVILGCTQQTGEQGTNVARLAALAAGLPSTCCGATVNRLCGSSLEALRQATHAILAGEDSVLLVGGLEHMHHQPMASGQSFNPRLFFRYAKHIAQMGQTAEFLAKKYRISRRQQDEFALRSQQLAAAAHAGGQFQREIVPVSAHDEAGQPFVADWDQCVRADSSIAALSSLRPAFRDPGGSVTAGNSSPLNDGAAAMLVMSETRARSLGLTPLVRVRATAIAGVEPCLMGTGPVPATQRALQRAGLRIGDIGAVELNEAFAVQVLSCLPMLGLDEEKLNTRGGAIALGHPLGASGARIATTLIRRMVDQQIPLGLATMCIGFGQGIAAIFERVA